MWLQVVAFCAFLHHGSAADLSFPPWFLFGSATAAYQVEGAWNVSDKGESIWDRFVHTVGVVDGATGDVACNSYYLWETDIEIAANLSLDFYRFSISWPRLLPTGFSNKVSKDGTNYYNKLVNGLLAKGIQPIITLYHWDLPQRLQDLGGWTNPLIADWFADYADVAFSLYGDRVKYWLTVNEPVASCDAVYSGGLAMAPGILDPEVGMYLCNKNIFLAHAKAYRVYDKKYRSLYHGLISYANQAPFYEPAAPGDKELAELTNQYVLGRYSHPVYSKEGGWPPTVEKLIAEKSKKEGYSRSRLPPFTEEEKELVKGTYDFFGMNHYTSRVVRKPKPGEKVTGYPLKGSPELGLVFETRPDWPTTPSSWFYVYPEGFRHQLNWLKNEYGNIPMLITENGYSTSKSNDGGLDDQERVDYYKSYLEQLLLAIKEDGVHVFGYTAWTLIDNFEWMDGYRSKFGLCEVNFTDPQRKRTMRSSAYFYANVIKHCSLDFDTNQ